MFNRPFRRHDYRRTPPPGTGLQLCLVCCGDFVYAEDRRRRGDERWWLHLRCGQCGTARAVLVSSDVAQRFDADVTSAFQAIEAALLELELRQMAEQVERFALALDLDLIDASDFGG